MRTTSNATWVRPGTGQQRPELSNDELVKAIRAHHHRRGMNMTDTDQKTLDELHVRAWGWTDLAYRRAWSLPSWADLLLPRAVRSTGYTRGLAVVLAAHRAGAAGVWISYAEAAAFCRCGPRTWQRWVREWERLGLVETIRTYRQRGDGGDGREWGRLLYRLGPAWQRRAGPAVDEGIGGTGPGDRLAERCGIGLRKAAHAERERDLELELARQSRNTPPSAPPPTDAGSSRARSRRPSSPPSPPGGDDNPPPYRGTGEDQKVLASARPPSAAPPASDSAPDSARRHPPAGASVEAQARSSPRGRREGEPSGRTGPAGAGELVELEDARARKLRTLEAARPELERLGVRFGVVERPEKPVPRPKVDGKNRFPCQTCGGSGLERWGRTCPACGGSGTAP